VCVSDHSTTLLTCLALWPKIYLYDINILFSAVEHSLCCWSKHADDSCRTVPRWTSRKRLPLCRSGHCVGSFCTCQGRTSDDVVYYVSFHRAPAWTLAGRLHKRVYFMVSSHILQLLPSIHMLSGVGLSILSSSGLALSSYPSSSSRKPTIPSY